MNYRGMMKGLSCLDAAIEAIAEDYEVIRLQNLGRVREIQHTITVQNPNISNVLLMAMVIVLFQEKV